MYIETLGANCFRNFSSVQTEFTSGVNILAGDNGSGKTNLLEAIHVLCLGRSQRGAVDQVLVQQESETYRLEGGLVSDGDRLEVAVAYQRGGRKKLTIDGVSAKLSSLYDSVGVVSSGPEDSAIVAGSPSQRRNFMDVYISQLASAYLTDLSDYQRVVQQKNAALKSETDTGPFNPLLVSLGSRLMQERVQFISRLADGAGEYYRNLSGGEQLTVQYRPSIPLDEEQTDLDAITAALEEALVQARRREEAVQTALVGPHRDEVYFAIDDLPARSHGSQGQWRSVAIALKLAVYQLLKERRLQAPILLLDEVFAELDEKRARALIEAFGGFGQLFLTTALKPPERLVKQGSSYRVKDGSVAAEG